MENHVRTASELERKYNLSSTLTTLKNGIEQNASSLKSTQNSLTNFVNVTYANQIQDLQNQIDGNVTTWFYPGVPTLSNAPAVDWTTDTLKDQHLGDMYYDDDTGYAYRFTKSNNTYQWVELSDSDVSEALSIARSAYDIATDHKRRVFFTPYTVEGTTYTTPQPPYDAGDLWVKDSNKIMCCINGRDEQGVYTSSDWVDSAYYTAHDEASTAYNNAKTYADTTFATQVSLNETETAIIGRVRRDEVASALRDIKYVDSTDPSSAWTTDTERANHVGDVWYDITNQVAKYYDNGFTWKETLTNGARIFTNTPTTPYSIGDIYLKGITEDNETTWYLYVCQKDKETGAFEATDFILQPTLVNYSEFKQTATSIGLEVSQKMSTGDFNKASIIAEINGGVGSAKIEADNINITGETIDLTADEIEITSTNFSVDKLGNLNCNNATMRNTTAINLNIDSGNAHFNGIGDEPVVTISGSLLGSETQLDGAGMYITNDPEDPEEEWFTLNQGGIKHNGGNVLVEHLLYNNTSGNNGNITLNENVIMYDYIEIFFRSNDNAYNSVKVYDPDGKRVSLSIPWYSSSNSRGYMKEKVVTVSGTSISNLHYSEWTLNANSNNIANTNSIYITRVVGYKL